MSHEKKILEADIVERLEADFGQDEYHAALKLLRDSGYTGRIARCIVVAAAGSLDALQKQIRLAGIDYRDVILAGEYNAEMQHIRDLRASFLIDSPLDSWVGEVAAALDAIGWRLVSLESRKATVGPYEYTADFGEGTATFVSGTDVMTIRKENRQWQVIDGGGELHRNGFDEVYDFESEFRDRLARMLRGKN